MMDKYKNFAELARHEKEGKDYTILYHEADSQIAIMAPHGGGIEPGTVDIADAAAGNDHVFYAFKGIKQSGNNILHINSNRYDEPLGLKVSERAFIVVTIHGCHFKNDLVLIGGRHRILMDSFLSTFNQSGFDAKISDIPGLLGKQPENICNRCRCGKGVQLEISRGLREKMFENIACRPLRKKTRTFYVFVNCIRDTLSNVHDVVT